MAELNYSKKVKSYCRCRFDVTQRYLTSENLKTTQAICYLSIAQFLAMFMYSGGVLLMRKNRENIPTLIYFNVIVWVYVSWKTL